MINRSCICLCASLTLGALQNAVAQGTLYVSQTSSNPTPPYVTWDTAAHDIQHAVDAADNGDTVLVGAGEYLLTNQIIVTNAISLISDQGPGQTVLNAGYNARCLWISNSLAVVGGFEIEDGYAGFGDVLAGGAVVIGGTLSNCIVHDTAPDGRLIHCSGRGLITDCQVGPNHTYVDQGAGIYLTNSELRNSVVAGMRGAGYAAGLQGAGVYAVSSTIVGCTIRSNWVQQAGGGVYLDGSQMDRCTIVSNAAGYDFGPAGRGGGVFVTNSVIRDSVIVGNVARNGSDGTNDGVVPGLGGGVYLSDGSVQDCTVAANQATGAGGLYAETGTVENSIICFNTATSNANWFNLNGAAFDYSCTTPAPGGVGNIVQDPQFIDRTNGNYRLASTSPCLDAGTNLGWMIEARDVGGNSRIANGTVDMGAWERFGPPVILELPPGDDGFIHLTITNLPGLGTIVVEASPDLKTWQPIQSNTITSDSFELIAPLNNNPHEFFRARIQTQ